MHVIGYMQCICHASYDSPLPVGIRNVRDSGLQRVYHALHHVLHVASRVMYAIDISRSECMQ